MEQGDANKAYLFVHLHHQTGRHVGPPRVICARCRVTHKSPELAVWLTSKGGVEIVNAQKTVGAPTGSGIKQ